MPGGGFTAEAAEATCQFVLSFDRSILELLEELIQHGLLRSGSNRLGEPRFGMHETARKYAWELAVVAGVEVEAQNAPPNTSGSLHKGWKQG